MKSTLKIELKKALNNRFFYAAVAIGCILAFFSALYMIQNFNNATETLERIQKQFGPYNPDYGGLTLFACWLGGERISLSFSVFFFIFPLLLTIPYGWSYCVERNSGYMKNVMLRSGKSAYYFSKFIAVFLSGGLAFIIPMVFNFLVAAMYLPAIKPDPSYMTLIGVSSGDLWSDIFYLHPLLFVLMYLILDFFFAGILACLSLAVSFLFKNRFVVVILPLFILLAVHYSKRLLAYKAFAQISPLYFMHPTPIANISVLWVILLEGAVFLSITLIPLIYRCKKYEIY